MTIKELIKVGKSLGLKPYNITKISVCFEGINGHATIFYTKSEYYKASTMKDFYEHIHQMGRDSLKMELEDLLNITKHK